MRGNSVIEAQIEFEQQRYKEWERVRKVLTNKISKLENLTTMLDHAWTKLYPEQPDRPLVTSRFVWLDFSK